MIKIIVMKLRIKKRKFIPLVKYISQPLQSSYLSLSRQVDAAKCTFSCFIEHHLQVYPASTLSDAGVFAIRMGDIRREETTIIKDRTRIDDGMWRK